MPEPVQRGPIRARAIIAITAASGVLAGVVTSVIGDLTAAVLLGGTVAFCVLSGLLIANKLGDKIDKLERL